MTLIIAPVPEMVALAEQLAPQLGAELRPIGLHHFPDGESLVTLSGDYAGREVALVATLRDPDRLAMPLRFAAATARELGARHVGLVAPYLGYMRQDRRFHPGEAVSAPIFAGFLEESFDWLVTADPHLHRIATLDRLFRIPARRVAAASLLADWITENVPDAVLLGPDSESRQWVADVARRTQRPFEVLTKVRRGDRKVEISVPDSDLLRTGTPVILDDIASSGRTLVRAIERLVEASTRAPVCVIIHAAFSGSAHADILAAGAARVVTTDSIPHPSNAIPLAAPLADATRECIAAFDTSALEGGTLTSIRNTKGKTDE